MHCQVLQILVCALSIAAVEPLSCYVGSKGDIGGVMSSNFAENVCEEGMTHCFESYSDDLTEITASCQTPNTDFKLLDVCKIGCQVHSDLKVTVCCCDEDLCNLPDSEKPRKPQGQVTTTRSIMRGGRYRMLTLSPSL